VEKGVAPDRDCVEVSLFGPGYGECIALHLGFGDWIVVDSCIEPSSGKPVALAYLEAIDVDASQIVLVAASHWDDDHIRGISEVFRRATNAQFVCSSAMTSQEFEAVLSRWRPKSIIPGGSGMDEFDEVTNILAERARDTKYPTPECAHAGSVLWEREKPIPAGVRALSPSHAADIAAIAELAGIRDSDGGERRRLPHIDGNHTSVVMSVRVGTAPILLGADLQVRADRNLGWYAVVDRNKNNPRHEAYKIPHHGSANADDDEIWDRLLVKHPLTMLAPFCRAGILLPTCNDAERILARSTSSYLTAPATRKRYRAQDYVVRKTIDEVALQACAIPNGFGHVRLRKRLNGDNWEVSCFGSALALDRFVRQHCRRQKAKK
jgi:hypothetical protein